VNSATLGKASRLAHLALRAGAKGALSLLKLLPAEQRADAVDLLLSEPVVIDTPHGKIRFLNHSGVSYWRARTTTTKEPDSLKWIDAMVPGSVFWDIGANVGVLTLYAAMRGDLEVWAFEPAAVNYYNLVANCELNHLEKRVRCLQLGFSDCLGIANLHVSQLMSAHSFTFKESTKIKARNKIYPSLQAVQLCTIDDFIARYAARCPNYIKIDVPGLTQEIFAGAKHTLAQPELKEIQVEAREHGGSGRRISELLVPRGFKLASHGMRRKGQVQRDIVFARAARYQPSSNSISQPTFEPREGCAA
jgi:FkbM family methyltransferase